MEFPILSTLEYDLNWGAAYPTSNRAKLGAIQVSADGDAVNAKNVMLLFAANTGCHQLSSARELPHPQNRAFALCRDAFRRQNDHLMICTNPTNSADRRLPEIFPRFPLMTQSDLGSDDNTLNEHCISDLTEVAKSLEAIEVQLSVLAIQMKYENSEYSQRTLALAKRLTETHNLLEKVLTFGT